jgi:1,4-dihydroxy-2-naphthoate octaprenyltransferase
MIVGRACVKAGEAQFVDAVKHDNVSFFKDIRGVMMLAQLKNYVIATRPWSFTMSLMSVTVGTLLAAEEGPILWPWFVVTAIGITLFHAAANVINDYYDTLYKIDQPDSPTAKYRPHPILSGMLTPNQLLRQAIILFAITFVIGVATAFLRSYHVLWIGIVGMLTSYFYTAGPAKLKHRALGEFSVFMMWGPLMVEGAYAVQRQMLSMKALYISIPFGILVALVLLANNMRDIDHDTRHNVKTLGIILGIRKSYILFAGLIVAAYASVLGMMMAGILSLWGFLILLSLPNAWSLLRTFKQRIPDMADALTAKFDTVFGILLIAAILMQAVVRL